MNPGNCSFLAAQRDKCAILASWYAIAGAIDRFGVKRGLPKAICPNNSCWTWGTRGYSGEMVLAVGYDPAFLAQYFEKVQPIAHVTNRCAYDVDSCLCSRPGVPLGEMRDTLKRFI